MPYLRPLWGSSKLLLFFFFFFSIGNLSFHPSGFSCGLVSYYCSASAFFSPFIQLIAGVLCNLSLLVMLCVSYVCCFVNWHVSISSASPCWFGLALGISILIMIKYFRLSITSGSRKINQDVCKLTRTFTVKIIITIIIIMLDYDPSYKRTSYNLTRYQLNVHGWHIGVRRHITFCPNILECQNSTMAYAVIVHGEAMFLMIIAILTCATKHNKGWCYSAHFDLASKITRYRLWTYSNKTVNKDILIPFQFFVSTCSDLLLKKPRLETNINNS